jgi:hypothetical protein
MTGKHVTVSSVRLPTVSLVHVRHGTNMPVIDMTGLNTQQAPMKAIDDVLKEYHQGFLSGPETINIITAISIEYHH